MQASGKEAGDTMLAARVLGHRRVNSRTMDRVYRADLRLRDLGRYWRGELVPNQGVIQPKVFRFLITKPPE